MSKKREIPDDEQLKKRLTPLQYRVTREKGTEPAFSGALYGNSEDGVYRCICCGEPLFDSAAMYDSGSGWPSFYQPITQEALESDRDTSHGMLREEIHCSNCGAHMGHLFPDGPKPTGMRYCINSASLDFEKRGE